MILVTEAGYQGMVALSACSTLPVSASTTSSASACAARGATTRKRGNEQDQVQRRIAKQRAKKMHYCVPVL